MMEILEPEKFRGKYRINSARLKHWDYSSDAAYFITICTKDREHFFGEIENDQMKLNVLGKMAEKFWMEMPNHFKNVILDEFKIMPNHIHGIIILYGSDDPRRDVAMLRLYEKQKFYSKISPKPKSISTIIRSFKSICTREIRKHINPDFSFQPRFHDRVIRNEKELDRIRKYIFDNPEQWDLDRNNL